MIRDWIDGSSIAETVVKIINWYGSIAAHHLLKKGYNPSKYELHHEINGQKITLLFPSPPTFESYYAKLIVGEEKVIYLPDRSPEYFESNPDHFHLLKKLLDDYIDFAAMLPPHPDFTKPNMAWLLASIPDVLFYIALRRSYPVDVRSGIIKPIPRSPSELILEKYNGGVQSSLYIQEIAGLVENSDCIPDTNSSILTDFNSPVRHFYSMLDQNELNKKLFAMPKHIYNRIATIGSMPRGNSLLSDLYSPKRKLSELKAIYELFMHLQLAPPMPEIHNYIPFYRIADSDHLMRTYGDDTTIQDEGIIAFLDSIFSCFPLELVHHCRYIQIPLQLFDTELHISIVSDYKDKKADWDISTKMGVLKENAVSCKKSFIQNIEEVAPIIKQLLFDEADKRMETLERGVKALEADFPDFLKESNGDDS